MKVHQSVVNRVVAHARREQPRECCGMLLGRGDAIVEAVAGRNLAEDPDRFFVDPADHIAARRLARAAALDLVGFYHSHPHSAALPSQADVVEAAYPEHLYLIVGVVGDRPDVRLFRLEHGNFTPTVFVTVS